MPDTSTTQFDFDVFLSHSSSDGPVIRALAERLRRDGVKVWLDAWQIRPGDSIMAKVEDGLERSRVLVLCMSANAFGSDWAILESTTFRFRDPLNKERRFVPLRLDDVAIRGSLEQFLYISWRPQDRRREYPKLLDACRPPPPAVPDEKLSADHAGAEPLLSTETHPGYSYAFNRTGTLMLTGGADGQVRLWNLADGACLRAFEGHTDSVWALAFNRDETRAVSGANDRTLRLWDLETGACLQVFKGHTDVLQCVTFCGDDRILSGGQDPELRLWSTRTGRCLRILRGHELRVDSVAWNEAGQKAMSAGADGTIRLWNLKTSEALHVFRETAVWLWTAIWNESGTRALAGGFDHSVRLLDVEADRTLRVLEGHKGAIRSLAWHPNENLALSGSDDRTVRLWDLDSGRCLEVLEGHRDGVIGVAWGAGGDQGFSGDRAGRLRAWDLASAIAEWRRPRPAGQSVHPSDNQVEYTNAKVLVVGDTNAGKTGLTHRLATGTWQSSADSTVGAWSTQWRLEDVRTAQDVHREIWLWDFGGQADQRLVHQLYMDRAALILLLFNADNEDALPGLRDWQTALRRSVKNSIPQFLVAGRVDTGFKASRAKLRKFAEDEGLAYHETSALTGEGCDDLRRAMIATIPWDQMEKRTSPRIFKLIKDEVLKLRDEGTVLHTFKELRELLFRRMPQEAAFSDETLQTVIGLLDGPGVLKELEYGTYILLAPEWINAYAQAVIRTLRNAHNELGVLPLRSIAEGRLIYQSIGHDGVATEMKRLPPTEERIVLGEMERQLEERGLCLRQGDKLVFPSHCGRDRPAMQSNPSVFVSYAIKGYLDDIYATLAVKLADSQSFILKELWRDAADFVTLAGDRHMGIKLTRISASEGSISVYFGEGVTQEEQVIFANYIHAHLTQSTQEVQRLRHYVCPNCHTPKGNAVVLQKKLLQLKDKADTECDGCDRRFPLWDALEKKFASEDLRRKVERLHEEDLVQLTARRKGKLLVLDVGARITSANQKWMEVPQDEDDGIDIVLEFTDDRGNGIGKGLCLQLKAGNSHLIRRRDGAEIFTIKKQRWVQTWCNQPYPVMLVIGTFSEEDDRAGSMHKVEFADVRWMEISSVLKDLKSSGEDVVRQFEFKGERMDMASIYRWRDKVMEHHPAT